MASARGSGVVCLSIQSSAGGIAILLFVDTVVSADALAREVGGWALCVPQVQAGRRSWR
jgi:hypothetical protein